MYENCLQFREMQILTKMSQYIILTTFVDEQIILDAI